MRNNQTTRDGEENITNASDNDTRTDYTKSGTEADNTPAANYEESLDVTTANAGTSVDAPDEKSGITEDANRAKVPGKTATDYSKLEKEANSTPAGNYEEPLKVATATADTSVEALDEQREVDGESATDAKSEEKGK